MSSSEVDPAGIGASPLVTRKLFRRYALWIGASVFALMTLNGLVQSWFVWRDTETALHERHRRIADAAAARVAAVLDDAVGHMEIAMRQMDGWARLDPALRQQEMYRLLRARRLFGAVRLERADGTLLAQAGRLVHDAGLRFDEQVGADARGARPVPPPSDEPGYGKVFLLKNSEPRVRVALRGRPSGSADAALVLVAEFSLAPLSAVLADVAPAPGARTSLYLIDAEQRVIAHSDHGRSLAALTWRQLHPESPLPAPGITLQLAGDAPDGAALISSAPVAALQALLVLDQARSEAWKPVLDSIVRSLLATMVALLLAMAVAAWLTRRMDGLLTRLAAANTRIHEQAARLAGLNAELAQRGDVAERANRAKTRFLAAASHDLRQPLHTVALLSDLLHRRLRTGDERTLALQMQEAVAAMDRLFQGILDLSKLDAGVVQANRQAVALGAMLERVHASVGPLAAAHGVALRLRADRYRAADRVDTDPVLLERILLNLVSNAIRYTPAGGGVLLAWRRRGRHARIEVWDNGVGIAPEAQAQVFEEFVQLHNGERDREQGLGLGLSVVRRLADLLGHPIGLRSRLGRGSCFHVDVPLTPLALAPPPGAEPAAAPDLAVLAGSFIVLVDDDAMVRAAMRATFADWGCVCVDAADVDEAIDALKRHDRTPDLLVCDHRLRAGCTGPAAVAALRAALAEPALPALVLTGDVGADEVRAVHAAGLVLLHKPVGADRLAAVLAGLLRGGSAGPFAPP